MQKNIVYGETVNLTTPTKTATADGVLDRLVVVYPTTREFRFSGTRICGSHIALWRKNIGANNRKR
jgi:hypothetical protein